MPFFIDIKRFQWLVLLWSYFFSTIRPLASSDAIAYNWPAPGRIDGIPDRDERPRDNGYKSVFTNSWIKGLGKNQQKEWTRSLCATEPWPHDPEKRMRAYKSTATIARHTHRNRNACLKVLRCELVNNKPMTPYQIQHLIYFTSWLKTTNMYDIGWLVLASGDKQLI